MGSAAAGTRVRSRTHAHRDDEGGRGRQGHKKQPTDSAAMGAAHVSVRPNPQTIPTYNEPGPVRKRIQLLGRLQARRADEALALVPVRRRLVYLHGSFRNWMIEHSERGLRLNPEVAGRVRMLTFNRDLFDPCCSCVNSHIEVCRARIIVVPSRTAAAIPMR